MEVKSHTHYIAIDFGTAGCGIAISTSAGNQPWLYRAWLPGGQSGPQKCPTIMLLDHNGDCEEFGKTDLLKDYRKGQVKHPDKVDQYCFLQYFKMSLYEEKVSWVLANHRQYYVIGFAKRVSYIHAQFQDTLFIAIC